MKHIAPQRAILCAFVLLSVPLVPSHAQSTATTIDGAWIGTLAFADGGEFVVRLHARSRGAGRFEAFSRRGVATELLGRPKAFAGRLAGMVPPGGSIMRIEQGVLTHHGDSATLRGTLVSPAFGEYAVRGVLDHTGWRATLHRGSAGESIGTLTAARSMTSAPVRDYAAIARNIEQTFAANLYDPMIVQRPEWRSFFAALHRQFARTTDDIEAIAAFYILRGRLPMSHIDFFRDPAIARLPLDSIVVAMAGGDDVVTLTFPAHDVAHLRITRFRAVREAVTRAFERVDSAGVHTLILDVRGNPGGDVTSMAPVAHLFLDSLPVGVFLGRGWYEHHRGPPGADDLPRAPVMTSEHATALSVIEGVREHGILRGIVPPLQPYFGGDVYLLVDRRSGSASEPLAHVLHTTGRATLVGENTAGAMLSAPPHHVGEGWMLVLPEADYFAEDGTRLEGRGVPPHIAVRSADAMLAVAERMRARSPVASGMLAASAHTDAGRWALATHEYVAAIRSEPWHVGALTGVGRAYQEAGAWEQAMEAYRRVLLVQPANTTALYQTGRAAAISGLQLERGADALRRYVGATPATAQPSHAAAFWRLGMILEKSGDAEGARRAYEQAVSLEPDNADYQLALAALGR